MRSLERDGAVSAAVSLAAALQMRQGEVECLLRSDMRTEPAEQLPGEARVVAAGDVASRAIHWCTQLEARRKHTSEAQ